MTPTAEARDPTLYKYTGFTSVPAGNFNANAAKAASATPISISSGTTFTTTETIMSNEMAIYRAVRASGSGTN